MCASSCVALFVSQNDVEYFKPTAREVVQVLSECFSRCFGYRHELRGAVALASDAFRAKDSFRNVAGDGGERLAQTRRRELGWADADRNLVEGGSVRACIPRLKPAHRRV